MSKRLVLGILLAVVASAVTASVVLVTGQEPRQPEEVKIPPIKALKPSELTKIPPGTPAAGLTLPVDYGRFHIVAPEMDPGPYAPLPTPPAGVKALRRDVKESARLDEFRGHDLFFEPPYIPAGWELTEAHAETIIWDDGSHTESMFALHYERPEYFYIAIKRFLIAPDGRVRLVAHAPEADMASTLGEIRGVPVVFDHQAPGQHIQVHLEVHFVIDDILTRIESVAIDFDELIKIADALIAESQGASG